MKLFPILTIFSVLFIFSCTNKEEAQKLHMENEELKAELNRAQVAVATLDEVGSLMDSIDIARKALRLELEAGTDYEDYLNRMKDINNYVGETEKRINALEIELNKSSSKSQSYARSIATMKKNLAAKTKEIEALQTTVENYKKENTDLLNLVDLKETEIVDMEQQVAMKTEELALIENRIQELMIQSQLTEADTYFALGEALEEAARRTKLAPKKRKETYREAVEIFKKALAFGREDAQEKIDALEKKIK